MDGLLGNLLYVRVYLGNAVVFIFDIRQHGELVKKAITLVAAQWPKIKVSNCEFAKKMVNHLEHVVDRKGVRVELQKIAVIVDIPPPVKRSVPRSFLGIARYYERFVRVFAA